MSRSFACPHCGKPVVPTRSREPQTQAQAQICPNCRAMVSAPAADASQKVVPGGSSKSEIVLMPSETKKHEDLIDMTAMVDIVFFLLIFFMVTSIQALESVIGLPSPQSSSSAPSTQAAPNLADDPSFITVSIEADDTVWVEDEQVFGRQDLRLKLRALREEGFQPTSMLIEGDPEASHGILVMVLDAGADAGMQELRFSVADSSAM